MCVHHGSRLIDKASYIWLHIFHEISEGANYENWDNFSIAIIYLLVHNRCVKVGDSQTHLKVLWVA